MIRILALLVMTLPVMAGAVQPDEILSDPVLETRARALAKSLRCPTCAGEDLDSSEAMIARDLRLAIRRQLIAGKSDREILEWAVARYGEDILMRPPLGPSTLALWFGPAVILALVGLVGWGTLRRSRRRR